MTTILSKEISDLTYGGHLDFDDLNLTVRREEDAISVSHGRQVIARLDNAYKAAALVEGLRGVASGLNDELVSDLQNGVFPASVSGFSELHNHFDANMLTEGKLGGLHISTGAPDNEEAWCGAMNAVSYSIDRELSSGRIREAAGIDAPSASPGL